MKTLLSGRRVGAFVLRTNRGEMRSNGDARLESGDRDIEDVLDEKVSVLGRAETLRQSHDGNADDAGREQAQRDFRLHIGSQGTGPDALANLSDQVVLELSSKREPLVLAADAWHRTIDKHQ